MLRRDRNKSSAERNGVYANCASLRKGALLAEERNRRQLELTAPRTDGSVGSQNLWRKAALARRIKTGGNARADSRRASRGRTHSSPQLSGTPPGIAIDDDAAVRFEERELVEVVTSRDDARA
jgi:hypothetical protein